MDGGEYSISRQVHEGVSVRDGCVSPSQSEENLPSIEWAPCSEWKPRQNRKAEKGIVHTCSPEAEMLLFSHP